MIRGQFGPAWGAGGGLPRSPLLLLAQLLAVLLLAVLLLLLLAVLLLLLLPVNRRRGAMVRASTARVRSSLLLLQH